MNDPTYVKSEINKINAWKLAFFMSELDNDNAPIGWGEYIPLAIGLLQNGLVDENKLTERDS